MPPLKNNRWRWLANTEDDPSLRGVVGRHFHFDFVSYHQSDETLTHLS